MSATEKTLTRVVLGILYMNLALHDFGVIAPAPGWGAIWTAFAVLSFVLAMIFWLSPSPTPGSAGSE